MGPLPRRYLQRPVGTDRETPVSPQPSRLPHPQGPRTTPEWVQTDETSGVTWPPTPPAPVDGRDPWGDGRRERSISRVVTLGRRCGITWNLEVSHSEVQ